MPLAQGATAPDFTLKHKTADGVKDVRLSDNFGRKNTVLLFFPAAFSSGCTTELCEVTAGLDEYAQMDAEVYAISVDTPHAQQAWARQAAIGVPLLSDLNKTVTQAYDVVLPNFAGAGDVAARAVFVIGKDGVIKHAQQTASPGELPDFAAVKAALS